MATGLIRLAWCKIFGKMKVTDPMNGTRKIRLTGLYNTMVAPAINYGIRGFLWNQGESNIINPREYAKYLLALIKDWREKWNEGEVPFLYSQLPGFMEVEYSPSESDWAQLRQSQLETLTVPNTGMAVTIDAGEWNNLHPLDKKDLGERLAYWAEHSRMDRSGLFWPRLPVYKIEGNKIIISFNHIGSSGVSKGRRIRILFFYCRRR